MVNPTRSLGCSNFVGVRRVAREVHNCYESWTVTDIVIRRAAKSATCGMLITAAAIAYTGRAGYARARSNRS
jgi:hypothetical protein